LYVVLHIYSANLTFIRLIVRTKATWELVEPSHGPKPSQRTGHVIVAHGDKILVYCFAFTAFRNLSDYSYPDLAAQTLITITMIPGHLTPSQDHGQNYNVLASFHHPEKVILLPWSTTSSMFMVAVELTGRISEILELLRFPVRLIILA
jgi:hypothetical protein